MKRLSFTILPDSGSTLAIRIEEVQVDGQQVKWTGSGRKLYRDDLLSFARPSEEVVLHKLMKEHIRQLQSKGRRESIDTLDFRKIAIDSSLASDFLKELAGTGMLYYKRQKISPLPIIGAELIFHFESEGIEGVVKTPQKEFPFDGLAGKGKPNWLVQDGALFFFKDELSWRWIKKLQEGIKDLPPQKLESLREELREEQDMGAPVLAGDDKAAASSDPLPVIALTDKTGAFVNLLMDYGNGLLCPIDAPMENWRKAEAESFWKKDLLDGGYQEKKVGSSQFYCPQDKVEETLRFFLELGWQALDSTGSQLIDQTGLALSLQPGKEAVLVRGSAKFGEEEVNISDVISRMKKGEALVELQPGKVGLISKGKVFGSCSGLLEGEIVSAGIKVPRHDLNTLKELFDSSAEMECGSALQDLREQLQGAEFRRTNPSELFAGVLRTYQQEGVDWLAFLQRSGLHGILADDMGLGKTVQVLAFLSTLADRAQPVLIVVPSTLLFHWKKECETFLPALPISLHHGPDRTEQPETLRSHQVILTSYATLRRDVELLGQLSYAAVFLDEAQAIKNERTQTSRAVRQLKAGFRLSMTGTPVENHSGELLAQFAFLIPGLIGPQDSLPVVKKKVKPFILRRRKSDVDEQLPEKIEQTVWLEMPPEQRAMYDEFLAKFKQGIFRKVKEDGLAKHRMEVFEAILRLRQICCHPLLLTELMNKSEVSSGKCRALMSDLETLLEEGQKALIYSQFTSMLGLLAQICRERGWTFAQLDGATRDKERVVQQFQEDESVPILLISLKAGGVGLNLTRADYVYLYEPWWNEAVESQAIDRAHRIGRHDPVIAKRYVFRDTIEEKMMALKESKRALASDLFENVHRFEMDDLEFLL